MLNPFLFFCRNKKRAATILLILAISVFCISTISTLVQSVYYTAKDASVSPFNQFSLVSDISDVTSDIDVASDKAEIEKLNGIKKIYDVIVTNTSINTVFGTTSSYIIVPFSSHDVEDIFSACGFKLVSGVMPSEKTNEIIVHKDVLKNKNLTIGDELGNFKIVGSFSGVSKLSIGTVNDETKLIYSQSKPSYLVIPGQGNLEILNSELSSLSDKRWGLFTYNEAQSKLDEDFSTINLILLIIVIMVSICLSTAVAALVYTIYSSRYDEFAILNAIGYRKRKIEVLLLEEISIITIISWVFGYLLSGVALFLVDKLIYADMGQSMQIFTITSVVYTLLVPIFVILCAVLPCVRKLSKTDLITVIERR